MKELTNKLIEFYKNKKKKLNLSNLFLHEPIFDDLEKRYVSDCIAGGFLSSVGKKIGEFENKIAKLCGTKYAVSTVNGTSALHLGLKIIGVMQNDEILVPTVSFVASANSILYEKAIPHFIDVETKNFCVDTIKLKKYLLKNTKIKKGLCYNKKSGNIIRALMVVHVFGHAANMKEILKLVKKFKLKLVEDAAEAIGSYYNKKHLGSFGDVGILSFNGNKIITTGGGGAVLTNRKTYALRAKKLSINSKKNHKWDYIHDEIGYNYRMPNINAAVGLAQLVKLKSFLKNKKKLYGEYKRLFKPFKNVQLIDQPKNAKSNFWLNAILLDSNSKIKRDAFLKRLHDNKVFVRPVWKLLHKQKYMKKFPKMNLENSENYENRIINLPSSASLSN